MKRVLLAMLSIALVAAIGATAAVAGKPKPAPRIFVIKSCPNPNTQPTYMHNVIVLVSGHGCASIDKGAFAVASGNAIISAHGSSAVKASGYSTIIVYNEDVRCAIKSPHVTVIDRIQGEAYYGSLLDESCSLYQ